MKGFRVLLLSVLSGLQFCNYPDPNDGGKEVLAPATSGTWSDMTAFTTAYFPDWSYFIPKSYLLLLGCLCRCMCYLTVVGFFHRAIDKFHFSAAHFILNLTVILSAVSNTRIGTSMLSIILQIFAFNVVLVVVMVWLPYSTSVHTIEKDSHQKSISQTSRIRIRLYALSCSVSILIGILPQLKQDLFSKTRAE